jgi:DNA-binding CsgD family transcriptional regulator
VAKNPEPTDRGRLALALVDTIYDAAIDTSRWQRFVDQLSDTLGGHCVGLSLQLPSPKSRPVWFGSGFKDELGAVFAEHLRTGLPWESARTSYWQEGFRSARETASREEILASPIYADWYAPHGFEPEPPVGFTLKVEDGRAMASMVILQVTDHPALDSADFDLLDALVPHLHRAYHVHARVQECHALEEALDRIPTGLLLLDSRRKILLSNRTARSISEQADGFDLSNGTPELYRRGDKEVLDRLIDQAIDPPDSSGGGGVMAITRRSGQRPFTVLVASLLDSQQESTLGDAVVALYISDLEGGSAHRAEALRTLYGLTKAEAELVDLLCEGLPLDEAALHRGVTTNTARSQLKQVFVKTSTSRQSELVRLVLAGLPPA